MPGITIFVEGADTEPAKMPVCVVDGEKYASRICEGMKATEYAQFDFSFEPWTKADLGKIPAWVEMIEDAKDGVYGEIVAGICNLAERMYLFMGGRRNREKTTSGADTEIGNAGSPPTEETKEGEGNAEVDETKTGERRGRKVAPETIRRADFAKPRREKGESYPSIYAAYQKKYPRDIDASEDVIRLAFERQYPELSKKLKDKPPTE